MVYRVWAWDHPGPVCLLVIVIICGKISDQVGGGSAAGGMLERKVYCVFLRMEFTVCTPS